jgi:hypothetical protein
MDGLKGINNFLKTTLVGLMFADYTSGDRKIEDILENDAKQIFFDKGIYNDKKYLMAKNKSRITIFAEMLQLDIKNKDDMLKIVDFGIDLLELFKTEINENEKVFDKGE